MKIMKKCVSLVVVGLVILCGISAVASPLNQADTSAEKSPRTPCSLPTNTTNLTITIKGGIGVTAIFTNTGEFNAINVTTEIDIINGPFHFFGIGSGGSYFGQLSPGKSYRERVLDIGLGTVAVNVTAYADNAAQVTKTAKGIIMLFFIIIK
jgi:hypothetical protein